MTCDGYEARAPLSANSILNWKNHITTLNLAQLNHHGKQIRRQKNKRPESKAFCSRSHYLQDTGSIIQQDHIHTPVLAAAFFSIITGNGKVLTHSRGGDASLIHAKRHQRIHYLIGSLF